MACMLQFKSNSTEPNGSGPCHRHCLMGSPSCAAPKISGGSACPAAGMQHCRRCELPLCRSCWKRMRQGAFSGIPSALCNDNFYGYPAALLYQHRVRWIETAAASPLWTSMVSFYLEADRGHVLEEPVHRAEHRLAVRGNISAMSSPMIALQPCRMRCLPCAQW